LSSIAAALQNCSGKNANYFRVFRRRLFICEGASLGVDQDGLTIGGHSQGLGRTPWW
jgi:hypothetical protein